MNNTVRLNGFYRSTKKWPTLKNAKEKNERVFAFVKIQNAKETYVLGKSIIGEIKIHKDQPNNNPYYNSVKILSTFSKFDIGNDCSAVVKEVGDSCKTTENIDFVKIDSYTTLAKNIDFCIHKAGRKCNSQLQKVIQECKKNNHKIRKPNFLNEDYPNHPGPNKTTNVEIALRENLKFLNELFDEK